MNVFKRLLIMGMCAAVLAAPMQAAAGSGNSAAQLKAGAEKVVAEETVEECRTRVINEIQDSCENKKEQINASSLDNGKKAAAVKKLEDKRDSAIKFVKTRDSKKWIERDGESAETEMETIVADALKSTASDTPDTDEPSVTPDGYTAAQAKKEIQDYAVVIRQDCYDIAAVDELEKYALEAIDNGNLDSKGLSELVSKTKSRMDVFDNSNAPAPEEKEPDLPAPTDYVQVGGNWVTPVATYSQRVNVVLPIVNMAKETATDVIVTPILDTDPEVWPFDIEQSSYTVKLDALAGENVNSDAMARRQEITWNFKTRKDVTSGYKKIGFNVQYTNSAGEQVNTTLNTYVKAVGAPGSGKGDSTSTPRLIVTGFETNPAQVQAGDEFNLVIHMKNTSKRTAVSNVEFTLKAATEGKDEDAVYEAFLPVAGSSTIYVENIPADGTTDLSIDLKSKADLAQKPYVLNINMKYEDENLKEFTSDSSVSIPVHQDARYEISEPEVMPNSIDVGSESNIMFSIYNTGKTTLYNVSVRFEGDSISGGDAFVGNIAPGGTGQVDTMVTGAAPTMDEGIIKAIISYEDNETNKTEVEKEITLYVSEPYIPTEEDMMNMGMMEEEQKGLPVWAIVLIVLIVVIAVVAAVIIIRKKKKARAASLLEAELADSIGSDSEENKGE